MKLSKDAVQLYKTLTNAQKEAWAIPVRAGFRPVLILNGKRKHEIIKNLVLSHTKVKRLRTITCKHPKCGKRAIVFKKGNVMCAICSSKHRTVVCE